MRTTWPLMMCLAAMPAGAQRGATAGRDSQTVLFVCEHGTAKSVLAMWYFDRLAREARLPYRAISRGVAADAELPAFMRAGLRRDGVDIGAFVPRALTDGDLAAAALVVTFDQPSLRAKAATRAPVLAWDGLPSVSAQYEAGRDAIRRRVELLIDSLATARSGPGTPRRPDRPSPDRTLPPGDRPRAP